MLKSKERPRSKKSRLMDLLQRPDGATLNHLMAASGWQAHIVRGFLSGELRKKMGIQVASDDRNDGQRVFRIAQ